MQIMEANHAPQNNFHANIISLLIIQTHLGLIQNYCIWRIRAIFGLNNCPHKNDTKDAVLIPIKKFCKRPKAF